MATLHLNGYIDDQGQLHLNLPDGLPSGEVKVTLKIEVSSGEGSVAWEASPMTVEELRELLGVAPMALQDIAAAGRSGAWNNRGVAISAALANALGSKR